MIIRLRRHQTSGIPLLERTSTTSIPDDDYDIPDVQHNPPLSFFQFDSLKYASTEWRNTQMNGHVTKSILHYGSNVQFAPHYHYTELELEPHRYIGDNEMDELLDYLANNNKCGAFDDVIRYCEDAYIQYAVKETNHNEPQTFHTQTYEFYHHYHQIPKWVDWEQLQRGIDVFLAYLPAAGCALYYRSLIGGFSIPKITEVLIATRYLVPASMRDNATNDDKRRTFERLMDTGGFLASCFACPPNDFPAAALRPGGKGWKAALRVRVLHAKVRRTLLHSKSKSWDMENGTPINQEDMAATLLAFSVNVLMGIEFIAGRPLNEKDQRDYLALWRYLGWLLGVDTPEDDVRSSNPKKGERLSPIDPCGPSKLDTGYEAMCKDPILHSYATLESMILHLLHPTNKSRELVHHLLSFNGRVHFRSEMCRKLLGDPLSDILNISLCSAVSIKCMVYLFLIFLRSYTLLAMTFPRIRHKLILWHRALQIRFLRVWEKNQNKQAVCPFAMLMTP